MPHVTFKLHRRRRERVVPWEGERGREHAAFKRCPLGALDQAFPVEQVVFVARTGDNAVGTVGAEVAVFGQESFMRGCCHFLFSEVWDGVLFGVNAWRQAWRMWRL